MSTNTTVVEVFSGSNYSGASLALAQGNYDTETLTPALGKGSVYSLKVASGYSVTVYTDIGACETFTADTPYFVKDYFNGKIVRVEVFATPTYSTSPSWEDEIVFMQPPPQTG